MSIKIYKNYFEKEKWMYLDECFEYLEETHRFCGRNEKEGYYEGFTFDPSKTSVDYIVQEVVDWLQVEVEDASKQTLEEIKIRLRFVLLHELSLNFKYNMYKMDSPHPENKDWHVVNRADNYQDQQEAFLILFGFTEKEDSVVRDYLKVQGNRVNLSPFPGRFFIYHWKDKANFEWSIYEETTGCYVADGHTAEDAIRIAKSTLKHELADKDLDFYEWLKNRYSKHDHIMRRVR